MKNSLGRDVELLCSANRELYLFLSCIFFLHVSNDVQVNLVHISNDLQVSLANNGPRLCIFEMCYSRFVVIREVESLQYNGHDVWRLCQYPQISVMLKVVVHEIDCACFHCVLCI